jgi:tRNA pseudouridine55 synthase
VYRAELLRSDAERAEYEIECSSGTYVRSLIETLDDAYCESLRRTAIGELRLADASSEPLSPLRVLDFLPERRLTDEEARGVEHGRSVTAADVGTSGRQGEATALAYEGRLLAVARRQGDRLRPEVVVA